ncbi:MAG: FecR domain-containing protein [Myxococcaceae bacterium]|nr:FecR domain-containing protein [Myxococcaceae bacterium]
MNYQPDAARRTRQRARFIAAAKRPSGIGLREVAIGALAAAIGSAGVLFVWQQQRVPASLEAPALSGNTFAFNEGSEVYLEPGAKAHVEKAAGRDATVVLESGELTVRITSGRKNVWRFKAGDNQVIVRGTKFSMLWKPKTETLDVQVTEGKVEVHTSDGQIQFVTAGERFAWVKPAAEPPVEAAAAEPQVEEVAEPEVRVEPVRPKAAAVPPSPAAVAARAPPPHRDLVPEWKRHADAGRYAKAVALVEEQGVDLALAGVSSDDLLLFADAARLARRADLGRAALNSLRARFAGSPDAAEAAFRLGRLEFDAQHLAEAGVWFDAYVKEAPDGSFATEAMGRRLDAWQRAKDDRAGRAASDYLERFPNGAYAPLARQVLERP